MFPSKLNIIISDENLLVKVKRLPEHGNGQTCLKSCRACLICCYIFLHIPYKIFVNVQTGLENTVCFRIFQT